MKTEIFYYSGTGFTLKAVQTAAAVLGDDVILTPVTGIMRSKVRESRAESVGLFFPMHAFGLPRACVRFMKEFRFPAARYIFSLIIRGGAPSLIHREIGRYLHRQSKRLNAFAYATAPNTFDIIYKVPKSADALEARRFFTDDVKYFAQRVQKNEHFIDSGYRNRLFEYVLFPLLRMMNIRFGYFGLQNDLYADDSCIGCGLCSEMCSAGKIRMEEGRPVWQKKIQCDYCLACLQLCPVAAVQVKKTKTPELERIFCQDTDRKEIARQNLTIQK